MVGLIVSCVREELVPLFTFIGHETLLLSFKIKVLWECLLILIM